jgi:hypothetical protein
MAEEFLPQIEMFTVPPEAGEGIRKRVQASVGIRVNQGEKLTENQ